MVRSWFVFACLVFAAWPAAAIDPKPGDVYVRSGFGGEPRVYHVDGDTGAMTLVARAGYLGDSLSNLSASPDGRIWFVIDRPEIEWPTGRLVRIDPVAFDPSDPLANQEVVVQDAVLDTVSRVTAVPAPAAPSVAAAPSWAQWLAGAALLWLGSRFGRRAPR